MFALFFAVCIGVWSPASLGTQLSWRLPPSPDTAVASDHALSDYNTPNGRTSVVICK